MQEKYKQLMEKILMKLENKFSSRKEAEEVFAEIGELVLIKSMNDFFEGIVDIDERKKFGELLDQKNFDEMYDILVKNNIDYEKVFQENFWKLYEEVLVIK